MNEAIITQKAAISVSQLNLFIKSLLDADVRLTDIVLCGEISNFSGHYRSGHLYFTLKDELAAVKAVMFSRSASKLKFAPQDGMKVIVRGRVSVYERDGVYQIYVEDMQPDGAGALAVAFEQLKKRLEAEGLFAVSHKKKLPAFPKRIGLVTSPTGAAVQDMLNIISRRWPLATVVLCPVTVQGDAAAPEIVSAIAEIERKKACDVIIVGRGGGSIEDLWAFNDERVVRAVYSCQIPIVSAVGHETDFTLCDFAADLRAPTPSAGAELVTPSLSQQKQTLDALKTTLISLALDKLMYEKDRYNNLVRIRTFATPEHFFDREKLLTDQLSRRLFSGFSDYINHKTTIFRTTVAKLDSMSPLKVLSRGYAAVYLDNRIVSSVRNVSQDDVIHVSMSDGTLTCAVNEITND